MIAGDTKIELNGANVTLSTSGELNLKGTMKRVAKGLSGGTQIPALPSGTIDEAPVAMELNYHDEWMMPVPGAPYLVLFEGGGSRSGVLDNNGYARLEGVPNKMAQVFYGEDPRPPQARVELPANNFTAGSATNEEAIANIQRYLAESDTFWAERATSEQREVFDELNNDAGDADGEDPWHYLNAAEQQALSAKLQGDEP